MIAETDEFTETGLSSLNHLFSGWAITETSETDPIAVTFTDGPTGPKLFPTILVPAGVAVGEDLAHPIPCHSGLYVTVTGAGTCDGIVRGQG